MASPQKSFECSQQDSTEHALIYFLDFITEALQSGKYAIEVYLDVKKAIDCVNHEILIKNLTFMV